MIKYIKVVEYEIGINRVGFDTDIKIKGWENDKCDKTI